MRCGNSNWPDRFVGQLDELGVAEGMTEVLVTVASVELPCTDVMAEDARAVPDAEPAELEAGGADLDVEAEI